MDDPYGPTCFLTGTYLKNIPFKILNIFFRGFHLILRDFVWVYKNVEKPSRMLAVIVSFMLKEPKFYLSYFEGSQILEQQRRY